MKSRTAAALTLATLTGCAHGHHADPPRATTTTTADPPTTVQPAPRPVPITVSRSAPLPLASPRSPGEGQPHTVVSVAAQGQPPAVGERDLGVFRATCYDETGRTASGAPAGPGSIAVDPRVIPLGTHLAVAGYGSGTADDTGGAIVGRRIDVWIGSASACAKWGVRWVDVRAAAA